MSKKLLSIVTVFMLLLGVMGISACADDADYYEREYPGYGEYAMAMFEAADSGYTKFCNGETISVENIDSDCAIEMVTQMCNYYSAGDDGQGNITAYKENINAALMYRYGISLEQLMSVANQGYEIIFIRGDYVFCPMLARGLTYPDAAMVIDGLTDIAENTKYAVWHLEDEYTGEVYGRYYSVMQSNNVNGKNIVKYLYLSLNAPSESFIQSFAHKDEISVMINGEKIIFDQPPQLINDRTMVPLRAIFEKLGAVVEWNEETNTVTGKNEDIVFTLTIGENCAYKNGIKIYLDSAAIIVNNRTLVPVRAVSEAFGCNVEWDGDTQTVYIAEKGGMDEAKILDYAAVDFDMDGEKEKVYFVGEKSWQEDGYGKIYQCDVYFNNTLMLSNVNILADTVKTVNYSDCRHLYFQTYAAVQSPTYVAGMKNGMLYFYFYGNIQGEFDTNNIFKGEIAKNSEEMGRYFENAEYEWNGTDYEKNP